MAEHEQEPLLRTSYFRVLIGDRELGFSEISPLTSETGEERHRLETVGLRRAITRSSELYDWRRRIVDGADDRRTVTIQQLERPDGAVANAWELVGAWPCRWSGQAFDARAGDVAMEELELTFEDLVWLKEGG
jgi:T4-like virus tail tube protein gp19